ncbi:putative calcium channel protein [Leptomonas seymouri]|uniref:Putative calcium channel protein n=1 Tax=Leptomonas seymouri TaxID=5684 RepID=A0A0N1HZ24_LEPSE|nr:putative calcium channel protein [Leptomonas seymouri]|eukprot:KPI83192.1 putative calcium channel protein [Leptomonas seymouri]
MSSLNNSRGQLDSSDVNRANGHILSSNIGATPSNRGEAAAADDSAVPLKGTIHGSYPRPALPPPLPPVQRGSAAVGADSASAPPPPQNVSGRNDSSALQPNSHTSRASSAHSRASPQQLQSAAVPSRPPPHGAGVNSTPRSAAARRSPETQQKQSSGGNSAISRQSPRPASASQQEQPPRSRAASAKGSRAALRRAVSSHGRSDSNSDGTSSRGSKRGGDHVEKLIEIPLTHTQPMEKFFIEYNPADADRADDGQPRNDNEVLLEQFAEYTDDDSFFSSSDTVIECDPQRLRNDPLRQRAVVSVHNTLQLRSLTNGRMPEDIAWTDESRTLWLYQIHNRDIALMHSSFFIFPARWTPRVVVYNIMHHWMMEMLIFLAILSYSIFQATWGRYTAPRNQMNKPDHMLWADVFYTVLLGFEIIARLFASGFIAHKRAFFRSPWHWLDTACLVMMILGCTGWQYVWNFTAWRLVRTIKCFSYVPAPVRMKLLAKSLLRSTNRLIQVTILIIYFIFFFGLLGLQLFVGTLHNRCVNKLTAQVTTQICRSVSTGQYWFYWGRNCGEFHICQTDAFPNPHYDFRSFDDIGHAMLSVFQIMTFQDWSGLMQETNDGLAVMAFLYYAFTILVCTWIVPSLYLGVFLEKVEKTSRLFVLKQLDFFEHMLTEQRQRMSAMVRLHDYVERDEDGHVSHYPIYDRLRGVEKRLTDDDMTSFSSIERIRKNPRNKKDHHRDIQSTPWTDEQRLQLQLALTRQRNVAETAERRRRLQRAALGDLIMGKDEEVGAHVRRRGGKAGNDRRRSLVARGAAPRAATERNEFALGGRVGTVQHHPAAYAIGASNQSDLPFAVRQEVQAEQLRFLDPYTNNASTAKGDMYNATMDSRLDSNNNNNNNNGEAGEGGSMTRLSSRAASSVRPPTGAGGAAQSVLIARETAGVVPNRRSMSVRGAISRTPSVSGRGSVKGLHASMVQRPEAVIRQDQVEVVINDPEGGDFKEAKTVMDKVNVIRNIVHMFTEGYPRIISQYLWEHRIMQYRYGLSPLSYTNKYEDEALRRLLQRRAQERREEHEELRRLGMAYLIDDEDDDDFDGQTEKPWMRREGLVAGSMSPIRMARSIQENAPITVLNYIWYFFIVANAVFNASRYDTMPDYWEMGTFVAGVCFSVLFMLELLIRLLALGPGPFFTDPLIFIEATFTVISLFQLGFCRANSTAVFNWVRFLRLFRVISVRPLRRAARVLLHGFPDMVYALIFFSMYMFMWLLIGMSFFGSRMGWIDDSKGGNETRGNFETFSHAAYAIAQAFSVNRDQWLYLSWSGMRVRGGYTIMYFLATVGIAFIFRFFLIAVMTYAWQAQQEQDDSNFMSSSSHSRHQRSRFFQLPFFDYSVWRSFKHIHGGFERRDVAPDEVYYLNEDMSRQLRLVEAKDRYYREQYGCDRQNWAYTEDYDPDRDGDVYGPDGLLLNGLQYINIGGRLYRQPSLPATEIGDTESDLPQHRGQLRFARYYHAIPATTYAAAAKQPQQEQQQQQQQLLSEESSHRGMVNPLLSRRHSLSPTRQRGLVADLSASRIADSLAQERANNINISLSPRLTKLGNSRVVHAEDEEMREMNGLEGSGFEHLLLPGPRLRYKSYVEEDGRRVFEACLDCNTHFQMPLRAPPGVAQRTPEELHAEHCHMAAVRSSQQLVLNALIGYARMQADHEVTPTKRMVEVVLGQAWSCGMLLFDTIENLSCMDLPERDRSWDRMLEALELQQWLLGLHIGEEQVGRATLAYILAHQKKQEAIVQEKQYKETWEDYTFFVLPPSNPLRRTITTMVNSIWFEVCSLIVIFAASICLAVYTPEAGNRDFGDTFNSNKYKALHVLDNIFTVIFAIEMLLKWISMGVVLPVRRAYFWHLWNIFDCFIVIISLLSWGKSDVFLRYLKVMRCFRILGPLRYWRWGSSSMSLVARTLWDSVPTLASVCLLMLMNYVVWAILFVSMFMNKVNYCTNLSIVNRTQCLEENYQWKPIQRNFRNFYESLLTTVEVSTGAEWMDVIYSATDARSQVMPPVRNRYPYLGLVFVAYYYLSHFVLFTLFISALIYCYMLAKSATEDAAGTTIEHQVWLRMQGMILRLKPKARLLPMNNQVSRFIHSAIANRWLEAFMGLILVCNMLTMALQWYRMSHTQQITLDVFQYVFIGFFTLEVILRLIAHGPRFFTRWAYCWDLLICILSYIQIILNSTHTHQVPFNVNVLRMLRVGRILHLLNLGLPFSTHFTLFHEVLKAAVPGLVSVTFIYMIAVYVFAILGLHFLGYIVPYSGGYIDGTYNNFATFVNSLIMVFRLSTLQDWATMLRASMDRGDYCSRASKRCGPTNWAPVYYIPIVICFFLMLSTMYMAVILDKYIAAVRMHSSVTRLEDLRRFCKLWSKRDPNGTMWLASTALPELLEELRLPLGVSDRRNRVEVMQLLREYNIPDHNGRVYYYEVLMPLARRVMAMAFNEAQDAHVTGGQAPRELAWRLSELSLGALPASFAKVEPSRVAVVESYAAAFLQAAYRRDRAMRDYFIVKSDLWRLGRQACDEKGVPYESYGFGKVSLAGPDPREEGQRRGFYLPKDVTLANAAKSHIYADPVAARIAAMRESMGARQRAGESEAATLLPVVYRSAINPEEKRFGPDAPDAIRRHERRDEKLERRRVQDAQERGHDVRSHTNSPVRAFRDHHTDNDDDENHGTDSLTAEGADVGIDLDMDAPYREQTSESQSPVQPALYHLDPTDASYQPPLGTNPEELRQGKQGRRLRAPFAYPGSTPSGRTPEK